MSCFSQGTCERQHRPIVTCHRSAGQERTHRPRLPWPVPESRRVQPGQPSWRFANTAARAAGQIALAPRVARGGRERIDPGVGLHLLRVVLLGDRACPAAGQGVRMSSNRASSSPCSEWRSPGSKVTSVPASHSIVSPPLSIETRPETTSTGRARVPGALQVARHARGREPRSGTPAPRTTRAATADRSRARVAHQAPPHADWPCSTTREQTGYATASRRRLVDRGWSRLR